ncbi:MAG: C25 family cysteine peptidase [Candidatus Hodarchaeota archaeon]
MQTILRIPSLLLLSLLLIISLGGYPSLAETVFVNEDIRSSMRTEPSIDYLIITSDSLLSTVMPLALWKQQRGLSTAVVTVENIIQSYEGQDRPEAIRNCITHFHEEKNTQWVLLAGNKNYVPLRYVREVAGANYVICDHYYANLDDNWLLNTDGTVSIRDYYDWEAEVYVGRPPAESNAQMIELVSRLLAYERTPPIGSWMTHALFAGTFVNFDTDVNNNSVLDEDDYPAFDTNRCHNWLSTQIIPPNWSSTLLAEAEGLQTSEYYYDKPINESNVVEEIILGTNMANFDAHGSTTGMYRMIFSVDSDNDSLFDYNTDTYSSIPFITTESDIDTEGKNGFYFLCACGTGNFESSGDSLAEYILRTCGIGCIASSRSAWYEGGWHERSHGGWYTQGLSSRFWDQLLMQGVNRPGKALVEAKLAYVQDYLTLNEINESEDPTLVQYNLLGDPEVPVWTTIPSQLESEISTSDGRVIIKAVSGYQPVCDVVVTLTNSTYYWKGFTDGEGQISLPISQNELNELTLTLSKTN